MNFSGDKSFIGSGSTLSFVPATSLLDKKTFWEKHRGRIITFLVVVLFFVILGSVIDYQMSRPEMDVNSRDQAVSIKRDNGTILKPGDAGFNEARKIAKWHRVH